MELGNGNTIFIKKTNAPLPHFSNVVFKGAHNQLIVEKWSNIENSTFTFEGAHSTVLIKESRSNYKMGIALSSHSLVYIGKNCYINPFQKGFIWAHEHQNVIIGDLCIISFGLIVRTNDAHLIYDIESGKRINFSQSVLIGDHVWIGQNCLILKGARIGSGSVIGANSVVSKKIPSNQIWSGAPLRLIKKNIFWCPECTSSWTPETTKNRSVRKEEAYVFNHKPSKTLENLVDSIDTITLSVLEKSNSHRFAIREPKVLLPRKARLLLKLEKTPRAFFTDSPKFLLQMLGRFCFSSPKTSFMGRLLVFLSKKILYFCH